MSTDPRTTTEARKAGRAVFIGSVIEYYDFGLYAAAATTVFGKVFFPDSSPALAALQSVATFAVAFLVRPIAGAFFGSLGDRIGRKRVLIFSLVLMGAATTLIGLVPSFGTIGWAAPVLLVLLRIVQGVGASAEFGGAVVVAVEFATTKRRGLLGALPSSGSALGSVFGALAMVLASASLSSEAFLSWGWRVPFLLSIVLVGYGFYLRRNLPETPVFRDTAAAGRTSRRPLSEVVRSHPRILAPGTAVVVIAP
jgi:MHS family shikimate/dehydroshikimate transporter-like MFS transporter